MMHATLLKSLVALIPICLLVGWAVGIFRRRPTVWSLVQLFGAGCLLMVVLVHLCEGRHWFAFMQWGQPHSAGHYLDLTSAILGLMLFPVGFLCTRWVRRSGIR